MTAKATHYSQRFRLVSVSQVRAMDRTAQLRGKYQSACKSHGSTCICLGIGCWCSARSECTGPAAVYTWSPLERRPVMPRRRPWQKYREPTGVISSSSLLRNRGAVISYTSAERDGGPRKAYRVQSRSLIDLQPVHDRFGPHATASRLLAASIADVFAPRKPSIGTPHSLLNLSHVYLNPDRHAADQI
jgi:hypothetical protein